ncbi:MAG: O-antigen ligase family protein [Chromatiales bacterium]|nr:O-antigen ligase family protein [Chromatiales bacterium]
MTAVVTCLALLAFGLSLHDRGGDASALAVTSIALLAGLVAAAVSAAARGEGPRLDGASIALLGGWAWLGLSPVWSAVPYLSVLAVFALGVLPLAALVTRVGLGRGDGFALLRLAVVAVAVVLCLVAVWQRLVLGEEGTSVFLHRHAHAALLSLAAFPVAGLVLARLAVPRATVAGWAPPGLVLVVLTAGIGLGSGRGSLIGLGCGLAVLALVARRAHSMRSVGVVLALVLVGLGLAQALDPEAVTRPAARLVEEVAAAAQAPRASERILIWQAALDLLADAPWHGIGAGVFWLAFAPYRSGLDASAGFHAHNDYLELAIELGWPMLAMIALAFTMLARGVWRRSARPGVAPGTVAEIAGLAGALAGAGVHALVSFNFHVPSLALLSGLWLGRLLALTASTDDTDARTVSAPRRTRRAAATALLAVAAPVALLVAVLMAEHEEADARAALAAGDAAAAERSLLRAHALFPSERPLVAVARLYADTLARSRGLDDVARAELVERAEWALDRAERANPLQFRVPATRAALALARDGADDPVARALAEAGLRQALVLDPRAIGVRRALTLHLMHEARWRDAVAVVRPGLEGALVRAPVAVAFYGLGARVLAQTGDHEGSARLVREARAVATAIGLDPTRVPGLDDAAGPGRG